MTEFKVETIEEEDSSWSQLIVKTDDKDWHSAELTYGTEDESKIRSIIRNKKYCDRILENFLKFLKTKDIELSAGEHNYLTDMDSPWGVDFGGVYVTTDKDFKEFEVGYGIYDSGSYWEPPSNDYCEHSTHKSLINSLMAAYGVMLRFEYEGFNESSMDEAYK